MSKSDLNTMVTTSNDQEDTEEVESSRRTFAALLSAFGALALTGCREAMSSDEELPPGQLEVVAQALTGTGTLKVADTAANLRIQSGTSTTVAVLHGLSGPGDGHGGVFYWSTTPQADDGYSVLNAGSANAAGWRRSSVIMSELSSVLSTRTGRTDGEVRFCSGVAAVRVGAGFFRWYAGDTSTAVTGMVLGSTSAGRWKRIYDRGAVRADWFGANPDWNGTTGALNHTALTAAIAWCNTNKEKLLFNRGAYGCESVLSVNGMTNQQWEGCSSIADATDICSIVYTGAGISTRFIDARSTGGFSLRGIRIAASPSSGTFTGKLIDLDGTVPAPTALANLNNVSLDIKDNGGIAVSLVNNYNAHLTDVLIGRCDIGVLGIATFAADFSNAVALSNVAFMQGTQSTCCIKNPGHAWDIRNCSFEALVGGSACGIWADAPAFGLVVEGCWFGDTTGSLPGAWIKGGFFGARFSGNNFESYTNTEITAISLGDGGNVARGVKIESNQFTNLKVAVNYLSAFCFSIDQRGNAYESVAKFRLGAPKTGRCDALTPAGYAPGSVHENFDVLFARGDADGSQTITNATHTKVTLVETTDPGSGFSSSAYVAPVTGWYHLTASCQLIQGAGTITGGIYKNAGTSGFLFAEQRGASPGVSRMGWTMSQLVKLTAGEDIALYVSQTSGGTVNLFEAHLSVRYVSS